MAPRSTEQVEAREEGLVRFLGAPATAPMRRPCTRKAWKRLPSTPIVPYNFIMMQQLQYAHDFEALTPCARPVASRGRRSEGPARRWQEAMQKAFQLVPADHRRRCHEAHRLRTQSQNVFINTSSDATSNQLSVSLVEGRDDLQLLAQDAERLGIEPLFIRDVSDDVAVSAIDTQDREMKRSNHAPRDKGRYHVSTEQWADADWRVLLR